MKTSKVLLLSLIFIGLNQAGGLNAQLGKIKVKKPKVSVPKIKTESSNSSSSTTSTSSTSKKSTSDKPEYNPDDPTYLAYSRTSDALRSIKSYLYGQDWKQNTEGTNERIEKELIKAKENIDILNNTDSEKGKSYLNTFETEYETYSKDRKEKWDSYTQDKAYDNKLEDYYRWATMGWGIQDKSLEPSYKGYYSFRKDFETTRPEKFNDSYVQKRVTAIDNFFKVEVYEELPALDAKVDKIIKDLHTINSRNEERYLLNAKGYIKDFEKPLETIKYKKEFLLEDKTEINKIESKLLKEKAMLDEYVNSGKCDAHRAKYEQEIIDAVRVGKKGMSNASYEAMAKKGVDKGTPVRAVVTSSTWSVKKNDFGYPLYKSLGVDIVVKKEGKCYLAYGQIRKTYEGGGQYGGEFFNYWGIQEQMNCDNINK